MLRMFSLCVCVCLCAIGTVRRFLENHGDGVETVVFAVSEDEEVGQRPKLRLFYTHDALPCPLN